MTARFAHRSVRTTAPLTSGFVVHYLPVREPRPRGVFLARYGIRLRDYDSRLMRVRLFIDGPPPDRTYPGWSADRASPNAAPLAPAAERFIAQDPEAFPLRDPFGITVVFGKTKPDFAGYDPIDPIIEVLVDVGLIEDERLGDWERELQDPNAEERYTVTVKPVEHSDTPTGGGS